MSTDPSTNTGLSPLIHKAITEYGYELTQLCDEHGYHHIRLTHECLEEILGIGILLENAIEEVETRL